MHAKTLKLLISLLILLFSLSLHASDIAKEKRWADQIKDSLLVGKAVWLPAGKKKFFGIYSESMISKTVGAAIVLHGIGAHPDWLEVINPVRSELPTYGWATLSIQMPILANEAKPRDYIPLFKEVPARIDAAIDFLQQKGIYNIVIIAHSMGSAMASYYLAKRPKAKIRGYIGIGMTEHKKNSPLSNVASLRKIKIPVLDLYGSRDLESVRKYARARKQAALKAKNPHYEQIEVKDADHFFTNKENVLIKRIRGWLFRNATGSEIKLK